MPYDFVERNIPRLDTFVGTEPRRPVPTVFETYAPPLAVLQSDADRRPAHYGPELIEAIHKLRVGEHVTEQVKTDLVLTWQRRTVTPRVVAVVKKKEPKKESSFEEQDYDEPIELGAGDFVVA